MSARPNRFLRRLVVIAVLLAIAPVIAIGFVLVGVNRDALRERSQEVLFAITDDVAHDLASAVDHTHARLDGVALVLADPVAPPDQRIAAARAIAAATGTTAIAIFDENGASVDVLSPKGATWDLGPTLAPELRTLASTDGFATGETTIVGDEPLMPVVVPVRGQGARWFVATTLVMGPFAERLISISRDRLGGAFDAVTVVDDKLRFIVHMDPERRLLPATSLDILRGIDGEALRAGILVYRDVGRTVGVVRSLPGFSWAVVAQMPRDQVYAPVDRARRLVIVAVVVAALLALVAAVLLSRRAARPIRTLVDLARDLGRRKFARRVEIKTGDELETLGAAMSTAAAELEQGERRLREEVAIRAQLGRYLPNQLVEKIVAHDDPLSLGGGRRRITVVFADIAAFTALAEREPPDRVVALLNQLFTILTEIVFRHGGTVDKLIGDCLMAFWGAPDDQPDHAKRAVAAAIDMQRWLDVANDCWETSLGLTIHLAIGVHTGDAIVGNLGSEARMEYTCVGDTVNVAARLESLARPQQILISEATRAEITTDVRCARIGKRQLPGRMAAVELHEVIL